MDTEFTTPEDDNSDCAAACARVVNSPALQPYYEVIFSDWPNIEDHYHWILTASEEEILDWADKIFCEIVGAEQDEW